MKKDKRKEYAGIDFSDEVKRLNRAVGQIEGIRKMLEEQRKLSDVVIQFKAVHSALRSVETRIFRSHVKAALDELVKLDKKKDREAILDGLEALFKQSE